MLVRELKVTYGDLEAAGDKVNSPTVVAQIVRRRTKGDPREYFYVFHLNTRNKVISFETVSIGTISQTLVHPREVFRAAIAIGAASIVLAHNHPSGSAEPSEDDDKITKRLAEGGKLLGIRVLDHVIVTANGHYSYQEQERL